MNSRFVTTECPLPGVKLIERLPIKDRRGFFERLFCTEELGQLFNHRTPPVQINRTYTKQAGSIRGLHYQIPPHSESKIVSCLRGAIFDIAVDIRQNSPTFLQWHGEILNAENHRSLLIPEGFAHGFQTLENDCELLYFHSEIYAPEFEAGLNPLDPTIDIRWPRKVSDLSDRDASAAPINETFSGLPI